MRRCSIRHWDNLEDRTFISLKNKELFRKSTTKDKLTHFLTLLEADKNMDATLTLALLKMIHKELSNRQTHTHSLYKEYAEVIELLRFYAPEMFEQAMEAWKPQKNVKPKEWFSDGKVV